jgi:heme-degrading monooxygenase HmoA
MIARVWRGRTTSANAEPYLAHLRGDTLPGLRGLDGYAGGYVLRRDGDGGVDFFVITFWTSTDSIRAFAGDDEEAAVIPEEAQRLLAAFDDRADHYTVAIDDR